MPPDGPLPGALDLDAGMGMDDVEAAVFLRRLVDEAGDGFIVEDVER